MGEKKNSKLYVALVIMGCIIILLTGCKHKVKTEKALKDKKHRYLTIINGTESTINKVFVYAGKNEDIEIESARQGNVDEHSFAIKIPKEYEDKKTFTVTFYDVYDIKYSKTVKKVSKKGNTEVKITEDDYVKRDGDWKRLLDKKMNN